jgi:hypothetical protein
VIARHSSEGSDYSSGMVFGVMRRNDLDAPLGEAYRRAIGRGHYTPPAVTWSSYDLSMLRDQFGALLDDPDFRIACEEQAKDWGRYSVNFGIMFQMANVWKERT